jgi:uncharacterized membrane protein
MNNLSVTTTAVGISWMVWTLDYLVRASADRNPSLSALAILALQAIEIALMLGFVHLALRAVDGELVRLRQLLEPLPLFFHYLLAAMLYTLIVAGGLLLLVVPGIIWAVRYGAFAFVVVDRKLDPIAALRASARLTRGHTPRLLTFGLLLLGINVAGALAFGVGLFVTLPTTMIAAATGYRRLADAARLRLGAGGTRSTARDPAPLPPPGRATPPDRSCTSG